MFKKLWRAWSKFGHWMGDQVARVLLTVFYFTIVLPFGLITRFTQDPLDTHHKAGARWLPRQTKDTIMDNARRAF